MALLLQEVQQSAVDLVAVSPSDSVRTSVYDDQLQVLHQVRKKLARFFKRQDPVSITLDHQHGNVDVRQVGPEIGGPGGDAGYRACR